MHLVDVELEHVSEGEEREGVVDAAVREQVRAQTLLLYLGHDHVSHAVLVNKQVPHLEIWGRNLVICVCIYAKKLELGMWQRSSVFII